MTQEHFALEVLLRDFSLRTIIPILIASVFGTLMSEACLGESGQAIFAVPHALETWSPTIGDAVLVIPLGLLCGLIGVGFTRTMIFSDTMWNKTPIHPIARPALGGVVLGVMGIIFTLGFGGLTAEHNQPDFFGNGYQVILTLFENSTYSDISIVLLLMILLFKIVGTCVTLGSGGSGGIFAPALFMGAALGGAFGLALHRMGFDVNIGAFALVGMAGMFAAVVHCPLTAFLLVFELTKQYQVVLPVMLVSILATMFSQILYRDTAYGYWLSHLGMRMGIHSDTTVLRRLYVSQVKLSDSCMVHEHDSAQELITLAGRHRVTDFVVYDDQEHYAGMVVGEDVRETLLEREAVPLLIVGELMRTNLPTVTRDHTLDIVMDMFARHDVASLPVVDANEQVLGMITRSRLMQRYQKALEGH